jgi:hypothetical protein
MKLLLVTISLAFASFSTSYCQLFDPTFFSKTEEEKSKLLQEAAKQQGIYREFESVRQFLVNDRILEKYYPELAKKVTLLDYKAFQLVSNGLTANRIKELKKYGIDVFEELYNNPKIFSARRVILLSPIVVEAQAVTPIHTDLSIPDGFASSTIFRVKNQLKGTIKLNDSSSIIIRQAEYNADSEPNYKYGRYEVYEAILTSGRTYLIPLSQQQYFEQAKKYNNAFTIEQYQNYYLNLFTYFELLREQSKELAEIREFCATLNLVFAKIK